MKWTSNQLITESAHAALRGELKLPDKPGYCLQLVRVVIEHALYDGRRAFYDEFLTHRVERSPGSDRDPWARDTERSLRESGHTLNLLPRTGPHSDPGRYVDLKAAAAELLLQPGDLLFRWDTAKNKHGDFVGHVAILLPGQLILENIAPGSRPGSLNRGPTVLSRLGAWPVTQVARLPHTTGRLAQLNDFEASK